MIRFSTSRTGQLYAETNGVTLTSRVDPEREAERFVRRVLNSESPRTVLVLGEVLGHIGTAVRKRTPGTRILQFYYHPELRGRSSSFHPEAWTPGTGATAGEHFRRHLAETDMAGLSIVEWEPSKRAFPEVARDVVDAITQAVREYNGTLATVHSFGRLWLKNTILNALHISPPLSELPSVRHAVFVAASGPGLAECLRILSELRPFVSLWSLPSSLEALLARGLTPDLVVTTDPGFYAGLHLAPLRRRADVAIAAPLSASRGLWYTRSPLLVLNQGTFFERATIDACGFPSLPVTTCGTVAGTALLMASRFGVPVVFGGLDLTYRDVAAHIRPHAFDRYIEDRAGRTVPVLTRVIDRAELVTGSRKSGGSYAPLSLTTYAGWFARTAAAAGVPVFRLHPSSVRIDSMQPLDDAGFRQLVQQQRRLKGSDLLWRPPSFAKLHRDENTTRRAVLEGMLQGWIQALIRYDSDARSGRTSFPPPASSAEHEILFTISLNKLLRTTGLTAQGTSTDCVSVHSAVEETCRFLTELKSTLGSTGGR